MQFKKDAQKRIMDKLMEISGHDITVVVQKLLVTSNGFNLLGLIQAGEYEQCEKILKERV